MRIALVSDIRGNLPALEAVVRGIASEPIDLVVNLGDLLSGAVQPGATTDRLFELNWPTVRGNQERQLLELSPEPMGASDRFAHDSIADRHRAWLRRLPVRLEPSKGVIAFHGTHDDDHCYLLDSVDEHGLRDASDTEVMAWLGGWSAYALVACGHSHLTGERRLATGGLIVNPGSVGWPAYTDDTLFPGSPHARYAIVDDTSGRWERGFRAVYYEWERSARIAEANDRPDVAYALRAGRLPSETGHAR